MVGSLDDKFLGELKGKFKRVTDEKNKHLSLYFTSENIGASFRVHVATDDYKKSCTSKGLNGVSAFKLADEASIYLMKEGYSCTLDMKNLPEEVRRKTESGKD